MNTSAKKKSNKKWYLLLVVVIVVGAGAWYFFKVHGVDKVIYKEVKVKKGTLEQTILATGTVAPENRVGIKPPIAGRIEKVLVQEGDKVHKGQILAWMSSIERAALLDAATSKGPAELKEWEDLYKPTAILAPINGMIIVRNVESGQSFTTVEEILVESDRLTVKAQV
jgi:macrolide-specific efflux system membrane fusion protein